MFREWMIDYLLDLKKSIDENWWIKRQKMIGDQMGRNKEDDELIEWWYSFIEIITYSILDLKDKKIFSDHGIVPMIMF